MKVGLKTWTTKSGKHRCCVVTPRDVESAREMREFAGKVVALAKEKKVSPWFANEVVAAMRKRKCKSRKLLFDLPFDHSEFAPTEKTLANELKVAVAIYRRFFDCLNDAGKMAVATRVKNTVGLLKWMAKNG